MPDTVRAAREKLEGLLVSQEFALSSFGIVGPFASEIRKGGVGPKRCGIEVLRISMRVSLGHMSDELTLGCYIRPANQIGTLERWRKRKKRSIKQ